MTTKAPNDKNSRQLSLWRRDGSQPDKGQNDQRHVDSNSQRITVPTVQKQGVASHPSLTLLSDVRFAP